jgi:opacity protein-like surface antigen
MLVGDKNMLNKKLVAASAALLIATAGAANAGTFDATRFNLGGEISLLNKTSYSNANTADLNKFKAAPTDSKLVIRKNKPGVNVFVGARFNENLGAEIGFGFIGKVKGTAIGNRQATNKVSNIYADILGYVPVASKVDLIGSIGLGRLKSKPDVTGATFINKDVLTKTKVGVRVGAGAQYNIDNNWAARAMVRYQKGNKNFLKSNTSVSVGAVYTF